MLDLAKSHSHLRVVNDQKGRPTCAKTLAEFMLYAVDNKIPFGLYQLSNDGMCTWYEFARAILHDKNVVIEPISSEEYSQTVRRPKYSVMSLKKVKDTGFKIPKWETSLENFLDEI